MEKIRIITDSGCDLPQNYNENITILPMNIRFGDDEYEDGISITKTQFYEKLIESDVLPATSLISPGTFMDAFKHVVDNGEKVIVITIASKLSGTYQSAMLAAQEYSDSVYVIDSKNVAIAEQILVLRCLELIEHGVDIEKIVKILEKERDEIHVVALLDTLEYLKKGGRISGTAAFVGNALSIKPVVTCKDGVVSMIGKARGSKNGNNFLIKEIESTNGVDFERPLRLGYAGLTDNLLQKYIADSKALWEGHDESIVISQIGSTIGTHIGPGAIAVAFFEKQNN